MDPFVVGSTKKDSTKGLHHEFHLEQPLHSPKRRRCFGTSSRSAETDPLSVSSMTLDSLSGEISKPDPLPSSLREGPSSPLLTVVKVEVVDVPSFTPWPVPSRHQWPMRDDKSSLAHGYGSEEDSEEEEDLEDASYPMMVPRVHRDFFLEDDEMLKVEPSAQPTNFTTPPSFSTSPLSASAPSSPSTLSSSTSATFACELFNFEWRSFPNPPVPPAERREVFSETNCGPIAPYPTPYEAFVAIWNREFMEYIAAETNRYAQEVADKQNQDGSLGPASRISQWVDTNADELYVFFALILAMGMCVKGDLKEYWAKEGVLSTPYIGKYLSINRFTLLSRCLHFNDNNTNLLTMTRPEAKIYKIAPVVQHLNHRFQSLYMLGQNIALDESLTQWKGWLDIKQFMKNKAASIGIKTYEVCEAQTGYLWRFKVYAGPEEQAATETPLSNSVIALVLELLKGLENKGYTVWMDNYYNSPSLARVLKTLRFDCVGTLRTNRPFVPPKLAKLKSNDMVAGQISGCTSGDVDVLVWRDRKCVAFISTYHGPGVHTDSEGKTKPIAMRDYNLCMGGVDKKDQMLSAYPMERKRTRVWYKKLFRRLLNASVLNAFILHKHSSFTDEQKCIRRHRDFRRTLIDDILKRHHKGSSPQKVKNPSAFTAKMFNHYPTEYKETHRQALRRVCVACHKRTTFHCPGCNVTLCFATCHKKYHLENFT